VDARLIRPSEKYRIAYKESLQELLCESDHPAILNSYIADISQHINWLRSLEQKSDMNRRVRQSVFWLVQGRRYIGTIIIRHKASGRKMSIASHVYYEIRPSERTKGFGKLILKLGIAEASKIGLRYIILSCDAKNIASIKIIRNNGGLLLSRRTFFEQREQVTVLLFKILVSDGVRDHPRE
jgi:predicted acetyltransferase